MNHRGASLRVGVVVITHRARELLPACLGPVLASPLRPRVLVVNSSSGDGTVERARELGCETWVVPRSAFNHGLTREAARHRIACDIVVMMTPDVRPCGPAFLERLTAPVARGEAAVAYARQRPRPEADVIERIGRAFAFGPKSALRSLADYPRWGTATHYCSNACAAWSQAALDAVGGFPETLVSEETVVAVRLLEAGFRIAYVAEAEVVHSHPTRLLADFRRQFDVGYARALHRRELLSRGRDEERGRRYLAMLITSLLRERPGLVPYAIAHTALRYLGYRLGLVGHRLPVPVCRLLSAQDYYWSSDALRARIHAVACASSS